MQNNKVIRVKSKSTTCIKNVVLNWSLQIADSVEIGWSGSNLLLTCALVICTCKSPMLT